MPGFKGSLDFEMAKKARESLAGVEEAQKNIGNVEGAVQGVQQAYAGLPAMFDQAQAAGTYNMRRTAGQQFAAMAGRGGASNAMASAGAGAANEAMAGQMAQFSSDLAAQRAQTALAGANADLANQASLYDLRQNAAVAGMDAATTYFEQDIGGKMEAGWLAMTSDQMQSIIEENWANPPQKIALLREYLENISDPLQRKAATQKLKELGKTYGFLLRFDANNLPYYSLED
jgi:3-oxoacyl-ACP reductase-like protein